MRIEVLGSGGAITAPRPGCVCRVCLQAREQGVPYARTGPSVFVHGPDLLIDTPEESKHQLNRSGIRRVAAALYSHWHPDHTMGRRVFESMNFDFRGWPREAKETLCTPVYLPQQVAADFKRWLGLQDHFDFLAERQGTVRLIEVPDGEEIQLDGLRVRPFRLAEEYVYAFLLDGRILVAMDELNGWRPSAELCGMLDLALLPIGIFERDPFSGERRIHPDHPVLHFEATYDETLEIVRTLRARRTILSHVEETDGLSHDDLVRLGERDGFEVAYDTMTIHV